MIEKIALPIMTIGCRARREGRFGSGTFSGSNAARGDFKETRLASPESGPSFGMPASAVMFARRL